MAFTSFDPFFAAKYRVKIATIKSVHQRKHRKTFFYDLEFANGKRAEFIGKETQFRANDAILYLDRRGKIELFRNFTQNENNFKQEQNKQFTSLIITFLALFCFAFLCVLNDFLVVDVVLFFIFLFLFLMYGFKFYVFKKQIQILANSDQNALCERFLKER